MAVEVEEICQRYRALPTAVMEGGTALIRHYRLMTVLEQVIGPGPEEVAA